MKESHSGILNKVLNNEELLDRIREILLKIFDIQNRASFEKAHRRNTGLPEWKKMAEDEKIREIDTYIRIEIESGIRESEAYDDEREYIIDRGDGRLTTTDIIYQEIKDYYGLKHDTNS